MILKFFNIGEIFTELCCGVYTTVAKAYNLLLSFTNGKAFNVSVINDTITSITDTIYVLVAVFMLFRITVTMFEYLINPDRVADKQTGAGKMITRIVISLILIMTFKNLIVPKLDQLQNALLAEDSILSKLVDVNAKTYSQAECREQISKATQMTASNGTSGENANNKKGGMAELIQGCTYYSGIIDDIENSSAYGNSQMTGGARKKIICQMNDKATSCDEIPNNYCVLKGVWKASQRGATFTINFTDDTEKCSRTDDLLTGGYTYEQIELGTSDASNTKGSQFAREVMATFTSQPDKLLETSFINNPQGNEDFGKLVEQKEIDFDLFICIIVGIALIAIILVLCIEVIIRTFKLLLLQILAPIAFISYINPNDKVLNNWFQKYVGCYLDLFIKILSIRLAILFISKFSTQVSGLSALLVYIAIFIFAKTIPNIITDILGIKNMGGTFKESMNALKTAVLAGTGALIGGAIGAASGAGKGYSFSTIAGGLVGGLGRGFMSGSKGHVLEGGMNQARRNVNVREARANGSNWLDRQLAHAGVNLTRNEDAQIKKYKDTAQRHQLAVDYADQAKSYVEGELNKGKGDQYADSQYMKEYRKAKEELARLEAVKNSITRESVAAGISHEGITDSMYNQIVDEQYKSSLAKATEEYNNQRNAFYGYTDKEGKTVKGLADLAIEEYYNNAEKDEVLAGMKKSNKIKMSTYSELADVDVDNWESVKNGKKTHKENADEANAEAYKIENSDSYRAKKASQDVNKK